MRGWLRLASMWLVVSAVAAGLRWAAPTPSSALAAMRHPQSGVDALGADTMALSVTSLACWLVLSWLAVGLVLVSATQLPGAGGRLAESVAALAVPVTIRRVLAVVLGVGMASGVAATAASAAVSGVPAGYPTAHGITALNLDWPVGHSTATKAGRSASSGTAAPHARTARSVTVRPGDTLWSIAARELPRGADDGRIAAAWPRWYAANRQVIGDDPGLLLPGERLTVPSSD